MIEVLCSLFIAYLVVVEMHSAGREVLDRSEALKQFRGMGWVLPPYSNSL